MSDAPRTGVRVGLCLTLLALGAGAGALARKWSARSAELSHQARPTPERDSREAARQLAAIRLNSREIAARREFLERFPESWPAYRQQLALGQDLAATRRTAEGIAYLREVAAKRRLTGRKHTLLATAAGIAGRAGQRDSAIALYDEALEQQTLARSAARTNYRRALLLVGAGRRTEALSGFKAALPGLSGRSAVLARAQIRILGGQEPADIQGYVALARAHLTVGDRRTAEKTWEAAARHARLQPGHLLARADNLSALGETTDASRIYNEIRTGHPGHPAAETALYRWAGLMSREHGAVRQARNAYRDLLRRYPRGRHAVDAWLGLGDLEVKAGKHKAADQAYRKVLATSRNPAKRWAASLSIGWGLIRRRKFGQAIRHFEQLRSQARDPRQKQQLARGLEKARER